MYLSEYEDNKYDGKGICLGMCMEFISNYFSLCKQCLPEEVLLKTTRIFFQGGSEKALHSQYLYKCTYHQNSRILEFTRYCAAASFFKNLELKLETESYINFYPEENMEFLKQQMRQLKEGIYIVSFKAIKRNARLRHAVVYCNKGNQSFIFCPAIGTIVVSPSEPIANFFRLQDFYSKLAHHLKDFYHLTGIYFYPIVEK